MNIPSRALAACFCLSTLAWCSANAGVCNIGDPLSHEQRQAVADRSPNGDVVVKEAISIEDKKDQAELVSRRLEVAWSQAQQLIVLGAIKIVAQHHDRTVVLVSTTGNRYLSREPAMGDAWRAANEVDPCGIFIRRIAE